MISMFCSLLSLAMSILLKRSTDFRSIVLILTVEGSVHLMANHCKGSVKGPNNCPHFIFKSLGKRDLTQQPVKSFLTFSGLSDDPFFPSVILSRFAFDFNFNPIEFNSNQQNIWFVDVSIDQICWDVYSWWGTLTAQLRDNSGYKNLETEKWWRWKI